MIKGKRRRRSVVTIVVLAIVAGAITWITAVAARPEVVLQYWATATFDTTGQATVHESIDYHFQSERHGIYRVLPDVPLDEVMRIQVSSDNTDQVQVLPEGTGVRLKIGDPDVKISGDHHYDITYPLTTADLGDGYFGWNGVGASWDVPVEHAELDLVAPWQWQNPTCDAGSTGSVGGCEVRQVAPGHLEISHGRLDTGEGITVYAQRGQALTEVPAPRTPQPVADTTAWWQQPRTLGVLVALLIALSGLITARLLRRAGRDWVMAGAATTDSAADLAFRTPVGAGGVAGAIRVDDTRLADWATTAFAPPRGLTAWQGGVVATEGITTRDQMAWLLGATIDGRVEIDESDPKKPVLRRVDSGSDEVAALLEVAFNGRDAITLGSYDPSFASMWKTLTTTMKQWFSGSGFVDAAAERRVTLARVFGVLGVGIAMLILAGGVFLSVADKPIALVAVGLGALIAGSGIALISRNWELHVRTPAGSAMWLRIESFRRFLAASEAEHVRQAAERGVLREYTAWAVALDEVDHWSAAAREAGLPPTTPGLETTLMASTMTRAMSSSGTPPSSSGGGGGGGVGGGGGGGGGGSW